MKCPNVITQWLLTVAAYSGSAYGMDNMHLKDCHVLSDIAIAI